MDYEKEYKEMVQRARELHESGNALTKQQMEIVCPALAESEDEEIRKGLIQHLQELSECNYEGCSIPIKFPEHYKVWIDYLEKHKKPFIIHDTGCSKMGKMPEYCLDVKPAEWSEGDKKMLQAVLYSINFTDAHYQFDSKEYSSIQVVDWLLASLRKRVNVNLKPEERKWSEEDSRNYEFVEGAVRGAYGGEFKTKLIIWLKHLGLRSCWKPSKEQMKILGRFNDPVLKSLYSDLKKLL